MAETPADTKTLPSSRLVPAFNVYNVKPRLLRHPIRYG